MTPQEAIAHNPEKLDSLHEELVESMCGYFQAVAAYKKYLESIGMSIDELDKQWWAIESIYECQVATLKRVWGDNFVDCYE